MDTIIDRAVAALETLRVTTGNPSISFAEMRKAVRIAEVRTVLEAIRDVDCGSPAVLVAGKMALLSCSEDPELSDARNCWHAMIDAVLSK